MSLFLEGILAGMGIMGLVVGVALFLATWLLPDYEDDYEYDKAMIEDEIKWEMRKQ